MPNTIEEIQSFLGLVKFVRKCKPGNANKAF